MRPLSPKGFVTLFVNGFGVQVEEGYLDGTALKDGDSVHHKTITILGEWHHSRLDIKPELCYNRRSSGDRSA